MINYNSSSYSAKRLLAASISAFSLLAVQDVIAEGPQLEEVVVTAQKRSENMQDVPLVVSAVTAEKLETYGVTSLPDLAMAVPGVTINNSTSLILPFIRGVGSFNAGAATYASVAVYVDGVYKARNNALAFTLDNVEQIEVLKGPQSTLYGRNATGGAITVVTSKPEPGQELEGKVKVTYGNYDQQRYNLSLSGSLSDTLAASITAAKIKRDGFVENLSQATTYFPGTVHEERLPDFIENEDEEAAVVKLVWTPTDNMEFVLGGSYRSALDTKGYNWVPLNAEPFAVSFFGPVLGAQIAAGVPSERYTTNGHWGRRDQEDMSVNLTANIEFENMDFISITSWENNTQHGGAEVGGYALSLFGFQATWDTEALSQEFRLSSNTDSNLQWMVGADYFIEGDDNSQLWGPLGTLFGGGLTGLLSPFPNLAPGTQVDWENESSSVFGEVMYDFNEDFGLTVGMRYTEEEFTLTDLRDPANFGPSVPAPSRSQDTDEVTYRLVLDRKFDWGMAYVSRTKGFVTGVFNAANATGDFVNPEVLLSHEIGFKSDSADGRVRLNGAIFDYEYEDIHSQVIDGATGTTNLVAGQEGIVRGAEFELVVAATESLTLSGGAVYLWDREYGLFSVPASGIYPALDHSNNTIAGAPELSVVFGLDHDFSFDKGNVVTSLNASYNSGTFFDSSNTVGSGGLSNDDSYLVTNLRSTYYSADGKWSVALWANNLFDEYYFAGGLNATARGDGTDAIFGVESSPRMYGVTVGYEF